MFQAGSWFPRASRWWLVLVVGVALAPRARGQEPERSRPATPPAQAADPDANRSESPESEPRSTGFLGDTKRFTRSGGWGSMGGAMGQFGFARTALIMMPPVQEELKLTESQKRKIREWLDQGRQRGEEMGRSWREQAQNGELEQPENLPLAARIVQFTTIMNQVSSMLKDNERGLAQILSSGQRKRLDQISLQMEGVSALVRPEVAQALYLTPYQLERIHQILALSRTRQMTTWLEQAFVMGRRPGQRPTETEGGVESRREASASVDAPAPAKPGDPADEKAVRAQREREFRKQFESMRDRTDRIHEEASIAILRVLNKRQRAGFDKLLGEPFDPAQINTFGRPPASSSSANPNPEPNPKP